MKETLDKYGVLITIILADCDHRYVLRMEVYAGKQEGTTHESRGPRKAVNRLISPIKSTGRNVDTSVELAEDLYETKLIWLVLRIIITNTSQKS